MIWRVQQHITVQTQCFRHRSSTKDHISSTSRISSGSAERSVSSSFGFCSSFFEPAGQRVSADTKGTLNATHYRRRGTFVISRKNLCLLISTIPVFRLQYATFATIFAPELLIVISIVSVFDNLLASAVSTTMYYHLCYHLPRLSHFTYFEP